MNVAVYMNLATQMFQRTNPVGDIINAVSSFVYMVVNYKSNQKLNQFRKSLYVQQLERMENFIAEGSPYQYRGHRMDRKF